MSQSTKRKPGRPATGQAKITRTYLLPEKSVDALRRLAERDGVSLNEAVDRAVRAAAVAGGLDREGSE